MKREKKEIIQDIVVIVFFVTMGVYLTCVLGSFLINKIF